MKLDTYLHLNGRCEEALEFYKRALGGEYEAGRFADSPMGEGLPDGWKSKIIHATFRFPGGEFMASDGMPDSKPSPDSNVSLTMSTDDPAEAERIFAALADGGNVTMALAETYWAKRFGMFTDRFGIDWMVNCGAP